MTISEGAIHGVVHVCLRSLYTPFDRVARRECFSCVSILPPVHRAQGFFFVKRPCRTSVCQFYFQTNKHCFAKLHSIAAPEGRLRQRVSGRCQGVAFGKSVLGRGPVIVSSRTQRTSVVVIPCLFLSVGNRGGFVYGLVEKASRSSNESMELRATGVLQDLHHRRFLCFSNCRKGSSVSGFLNRIVGGGRALLTGNGFLRCPIGQRSISFAKAIERANRPFFFQVCSERLFLRLLCILENVGERGTGVWHSAWQQCNSYLSSPSPCGGGGRVVEAIARRSLQHELTHLRSTLRDRGTHLEGMYNNVP